MGRPLALLIKHCCVYDLPIFKHLSMLSVVISVDFCFFSQNVLLHFIILTFFMSSFCTKVLVNRNSYTIGCCTICCWFIILTKRGKSPVFLLCACQNAMLDTVFHLFVTPEQKIRD